MIEIVPFELEHLETFVPGDREQLLMNMWEHEVAPEFIGKAVSLRDFGKTLGVAGIAWVNGIPRISALISDELRGKPMLLHRLVKRKIPEVMDFFGLTELEAGARSGDGAANRWLTSLGFSFHHLELPFNVYRYVRIG